MGIHYKFVDNAFILQRMLRIHFNALQLMEQIYLQILEMF